MKSLGPAPFFSIVIPALNEEKFLPNLLKDLIKQSFTDFQVVVVDGRSTDQTVAKSLTLAKQLPLTVITSQVRHVSHQRNLGLKHSRGKWVIFIDADARLPH